ncbi:MAG: adenylosuccinate lyase [Candidatus Diapherotrites archaeon]|nr:adenylosuccinate lyase [Candidatus Diapherotrites archaeon]
MDLFDSISPLDYRYYGRDKQAFSALQPFLSERARVKYLCRVESALARVLAKKGICSAQIAREIEGACNAVSVEEMYEQEDVLRHDIRGLANAIRSKVSDTAKPFVHFSATSYDIVDSANALRFKEAAEKALLPALMELERVLMDLALREKDTIQIGRTHGQHAEPITFGLFIAGYVSRLGNRIQAIERSKNALTGKFSGAVGAYNASSLLVQDPLEFELEVMRELGLSPSVSSTQIVEPEPLTDFMHALISCFGVLANFADDMRHLQRSEIGETGEAFETKQVGSSTMPQKRNPINFENVKSFWKAFVPRMTTVYLDQVSEHQRDLTNSASQRFLPEMIVALYLCTVRLSKVVSRARVDHANMERNFDLNKSFIAAEPLYILLAFHGHPDAHEAVRGLTLKAQLEGKGLMKIARSDKTLTPFLDRFTPAQRALLEDPLQYTGIASKKTTYIAEHWKKELGL